MRLTSLRVLLADPRARSRHHMILRSPGNLHHRDYWSETWSGLGQLAYVGPPRLPQGIQESVRFLDPAGWCPRSQGLSVPSGHKPATCSGEEDDSFRQTPTISWQREGHVLHLQFQGPHPGWFPSSLHGQEHWFRVQHLTNWNWWW